ncbi:MAG: hypothetical protein PHW84_15420, partial [Methanosarcina sp.]|nr:hypothetical protein [Methanosarcina sp.]
MGIIENSDGVGEVGNA